ncbi:hypothetical protein D3C81_1317290 [compost metagenome]
MNGDFEQAWVAYRRLKRHGCSVPLEDQADSTAIDHCIIRYAYLEAAANIPGVHHALIVTLFRVCTDNDRRRQVQRSAQCQIQTLRMPGHASTGILVTEGERLVEVILVLHPLAIV